jgi:hypothetical protein
MWVPNLDRASATWGWLLGELGYDLFQDWPGGKSWRSGPTYIVFEQSPARTAIRHDRCRPGLNHLAFHVESRARADALAEAAAAHGWRLMFAEQHPYAGGKGHYAAYLENVDGYEAELVAPSEEDEPLPPAPSGAAPPGPPSPGPPSPPPGAPPSPATPAAPVTPAPPVTPPPPAATPAPPAGREQHPPAGSGSAATSATARPAVPPAAAAENDAAQDEGGAPPAPVAPPAR